MSVNKLTTRTFKLSVTTSVQQLVSSNPKRKCFLVCNNGTGTVYILSAQNMTINDGIPVLIGETYENDTSTDAYWIVAASGTQDVRVQVDSE